MITRLLLILFLPIIVSASPSWMFNIDHEESIIIGYGVGASLAEAKQNALSDITNSISVQVASNIHRSTSDINGKITNNASANITTASQAHLSGVKYIKIAEEKDHWYVAAQYNDSPFSVRFKKLLYGVKQNEQQNSYLKGTSLFHTLNNEINYTLNYEIIRKDNLWQVKYGNSILPLEQENFYNLFSAQKRDDLSIIANKKIYKENDEMYFNIQHKSPGYISILYVEHNGKVGILLDNYYSKTNFIYPDTKAEDLFLISNPYGRTIHELYVVLYSKQRLNLHEFEDISNKQLDESNYNFHKLIKLLNIYSFSTYTIKIQ